MFMRKFVIFMDILLNSLININLKTQNYASKLRTKEICKTI